MSATPPPGSADASRPTPRKVLKGGLSARHVGPWLARGLYRSGRAASAIKKRKKRPTGRGPVIAASPWLECERAS